MRRLLLTLGVAGTCAAALIAGGATAAVPDSSRAAVTDQQAVQPAAWVCRWYRWRWPHRRCFETFGYYGGPYWGGPYWGGPGFAFGFGFGGPRWHHWR